MTYIIEQLGMGRLASSSVMVEDYFWWDPYVKVAIITQNFWIHRGLPANIYSSVFLVFLHLAYG